MDGGISVADAMALRNDNNGFMGNDAWVFFLFFLLAFNNGGGLFGGGNQGALTRADFNAGLDSYALQRQAEDNAQGLARATYDLRSALDQCCCTTNRNIDSVKSEICNQTNALTNAIHAEGEATRALINANTMQALRDENQNLKSNIATAVQTDNILQALGRYVTNPPCPQPYYCGCGCNGQF